MQSKNIERDVLSNTSWRGKDQQEKATQTVIEFLRKCLKVAILHTIGMIYNRYIQRTSELYHLDRLPWSENRSYPG
jgi:hypothetical protein